MPIQIFFKEIEVDSVSWKLKDETPIISPGLITSIEEIYVDGDELQYVADTFCNNVGAHPRDKRYSIPMPMRHKWARWYGALAQTIIANL